MSMQVISLAAQFGDLPAVEAMAARLTEPNSATLLLLGLVGVLVGRFLIAGRGSSAD